MVSTTSWSLIFIIFLVTNFKLKHHFLWLILIILLGILDTCLVLLRNILLILRTGVKTCHVNVTVLALKTRIYTSYLESVQLEYLLFWHWMIFFNWTIENHSVWGSCKKSLVVFVPTNWIYLWLRTTCARTWTRHFYLHHLTTCIKTVDIYYLIIIKSK